jgi:hypothetical protein
MQPDESQRLLIFLPIEKGHTVIGPGCRSQPGLFVSKNPRTVALGSAVIGNHALSLGLQVGKYPTKEQRCRNGPRELG